MTKEDYYKNLKIDYIIYDDRDNNFVKMATAWTEEKVPQDDDSIWADGLDQYNQGRMVSVKELDHWHFITNESSMEVQFKWLQMEFKELSDFVHSRLK